MARQTKDKRDVYSRRAKECEFRARSAYKLLDIDNEFRIFGPDVRKVLDLCGAPGSWSQVIVSKLGHPKQASSCIVSVDLQEMAPIDGVTALQGDITSEHTLRQIMEAFHQTKCDLVVCDGALDVTGSHIMDEKSQLDLLTGALRVCLVSLNPGGNFVCKYFKDNHPHCLVELLALFFAEVYTYKPPSSREQSAEGFVICKSMRYV